MRSEAQEAEQVVHQSEGRRLLHVGRDTEPQTAPDWLNRQCVCECERVNIGLYRKAL